jgi:hypothetical protein
MPSATQIALALHGLLFLGSGIPLVFNADQVSSDPEHHFNGTPADVVRMIGQVLNTTSHPLRSELVHQLIANFKLTCAPLGPHSSRWRASTSSLRTKRTGARSR